MEEKLVTIPLRGPVLDVAAIDENGMRADSRSVDQFRTVQMRLGVLAKAAGSACVELGNTRVLCSVTGPTQTEGKEYLTRATLECSLRFTSFAKRSRRRTVPGGAPDERTLSGALHTALAASVQLEQYPKSMIAVNVLVIQDDGGSLAAAMMCASLALAHAGLLMYDLVAASTCAMLHGVIALDPSANELIEATGRLTVGHMCELNQVTMMQADAAISFARMTEVLQLALDGCAKLHAHMRAVLSERINAEGSADPSVFHSLPTCAQKRVRDAPQGGDTGSRQDGSTE
mmetsp:Transcript_14557/g.31555  ORF Transcript_14557/g.31555 Transcript_14557/m.31555 type:complete len:288 (-) Transcript_14557:248-1111(-)